MIIDDFLKLTDKEVKRYIKQCGVASIEELYSSKNFIDNLELENVGTIMSGSDIELSGRRAVLKVYHRNQVNGLKVSIYYNYAPEIPNTPAAELTLRIYPTKKGGIGILHWEESYNGFIYKINNNYFNDFGSEDLYIWKVTKYSDYKRPWDYLEALKEERKSLDPLLTEATNALWNGDLDSLFLMYTGELIDPGRNNFHEAAGYTTMIKLGATNSLSLEDSFICYISRVIYEKKYNRGEFSAVKEPLIDYLENTTGGYTKDVINYLNDLYNNKDNREIIKKILLSNVDKEILKAEALKRLQKQKKIISESLGLDPGYFLIMTK